MTMAPVQPALIGKHPDYGDFVRHGLPPEMSERLMRWMDTTLARVKSAAGDDWEAFWDGAQATRFWLGRDVLGTTAIGILLPSRDRVGRRYPLLTLALGVGLPPPFEDRADPVFERIEQHLNHARGGSGGGAAALVETLDLSDLPREGARPDPIIWAHHPDGDLDALMHRAARVDHALCAAARSYWWAPARGWRAAAWLGCTGLPGHEALSWLLSGEEVAPEPLPEAPDATTAPTDLPRPLAAPLPPLAGLPVVDDAPASCDPGAAPRATQPVAGDVRPDPGVEITAPDLTQGVPK